MYRILTKLFKETDFHFYQTLDTYDMFRPLRFYMQLFGLAIFAEVSNEKGEKMYKLTIWSIIRCLLIKILYSICFYEHFQFLKIINSIVDDFSVAIVANFLSYILSYMEILMGSAFCKDVIKLFKQFVSIDKGFKNIDIPIWTTYR